MPGITTLASLIRTHGAALADRPALEYEGRSVTFGELDRRSSQAASALRSLGVAAGSRVGYVGRNAPEHFEVTFGAAKLNAVAVSVNWRLAPAEMAQIIRDATARVVVVAPEFAGHLEKVEGELAGVTMVALGAHDRWPEYHQLLAAQPATDPGAGASPADVAVQLYTSGTTGLPKGVMLSNANLFDGADEFAAALGLDADAVNLVAMPLFHIGGIGWALTGLALGCRTVLLPEVDPARILAAIPAFGVTTAFLVPAVVQMLLATPGVESGDYSSLRRLLYGASPISERVLVQGMETFGCEFAQLYGLTETSGAIVQLAPADHDPALRPHLLRACGKPYPWVEVRVVDPATGEDATVGAVGEVWTRSRRNMPGYWNNPAATAAALTSDGWFKTGDAGYTDAEGYLYLHDRVKDMIVSGGENVYPAEVENALMKHPAVADVAVIGVPDERWGEAVKAVVVAAPGCSPTTAELIDFSREHLGGFKVPKSVDFATALPRNPSGKLLKRELREPYWAGVERRIG
jgi:long-chain acyl-CoA synthetase